jgi:hypothetical protein
LSYVDKNIHVIVEIQNNAMEIIELIYFLNLLNIFLSS